jgi:hypothetical protein
MGILDPITVVNRALALVGIEPIQSFADEFAGSSAGDIYQSVIGFNVGLYPWSFATEMRALGQKTGTSGFGYSYMHELPADRLGPPLRLSDIATDPTRQFTAYLLSANLVHSNSATIYALTKFMPDPDRWSATFAHASVLSLAAEFAETLGEDAKARAEYREDAYGTPLMAFRGGAMGAAIQEDARATPPRKLPFGSNPLLQAHNS